MHKREQIPVLSPVAYSINAGALTTVYYTYIEATYASAPEPEQVMTSEQANELTARVQAAIARSVAKGVPHREAFNRHMEELKTDYPAVFTAYVSLMFSK